MNRGLANLKFVGRALLYRHSLHIAILSPAYVTSDLVGNRKGTVNSKTTELIDSFLRSIDKKKSSSSLLPFPFLIRSITGEYNNLNLD